MRYDSGNPQANGFRIRVTRNETASPLGRVFIARGLIDMQRQFLPLAGISEIPQVRFFTISDLLGNGAPTEEIQDLALERAAGCDLPRFGLFQRYRPGRRL